jgi:hypothetical protein
MFATTTILNIIVFVCEFLKYSTCIALDIYDDDDCIELNWIGWPVATHRTNGQSNEIPPLDGWSGQLGKGLGLGWDNPNPFALLKTIIHSHSPFKDEWEY